MNKLCRAGPDCPASGGAYDKADALDEMTLNKLQDDTVDARHSPGFMIRCLTLKF